MDGFIVINKEKGLTSFDVIRKVRKILGMKKVGHSGTLDPMATGILILGVGRATRLLSEIESKEKAYKGEMLLGFRTDTLDTTGKIIEKKEIKNYESYHKNLKEILSEFEGEILQTPPMYSAIKLNGKKLYELARKDIVVERKKREIFIEYVKILNIENEKITFLTKVSKGTYIRSLVNDIGEKLGCFATMSALDRVKVGKIDLTSAYNLDQIKEKNDNKCFDFLITMEKYFEYLNKIVLENDREAKTFENGHTLIKNQNDDLYRIYYGEKFMGLGKVLKNRLKGYRCF